MQSAVIGEYLTGRGPLAQFSMETGLSTTTAIWGILLLLAFNVLVAILPGPREFATFDDYSDRPEGPLQVWKHIISLWFLMTCYQITNIDKSRAMY